MRILIDLHIHSNASFDSILSPKIITKILKRRRLHGYALTDHDTTENLEKAEFYANKNGLIFIPGIEKKTDKGDILGLFIRENIISFNFDDAINEIKEKDGITILPHPFKSHENMTEEDWKKFDAIEVLNGRCTDEMNAKSKIRVNGMVQIGGSDAHASWEVASVFTQLFMNKKERISAKLIKKAIKSGNVSPCRKKDFNHQQYLWTVRYSRMIKTTKESNIVRWSIDLMRRFFCQR